MKILVVEDDPAVAQTLQILLSSYNYAVDVAADGEAGWQMADAYEYDLMLLDVLLPKLDGIHLCQRLRSQGFRNPILLLTGQGAGRQKAIALNAGADDYVVKPFDPEELIARVQALLRRGGAIAQPILTWGELSIDPSSRKVTYGTHLLFVTPKEYSILELFLRNPHQVLSPRAILDHVWNSSDTPSEEAVRVHIKEIRHKLKAAGAPPDWIKTVYQMGYRLNPLYSSVLADEVKQHPTTSNVAELTSVNEELRSTLEKLQAAQEELRQQNQALAVAHRAIEQERQKYRDLFEFAPDGYLVTDICGQIQEANRAAATLLGVESEALIGQPLATYIATADRSAFRTRLARLEWGEDWEVMLQTPRGDPFPALITVSHQLDGQNQAIGLHWLLRDIRHRKQMEQQLQAAHDELERCVAERTAELAEVNLQLQQQEHQWQALFEHALDAMVIANDQGRYVDANPAACRLFGLSREEMLQLGVGNFAEPGMDVGAVWQQFLQQGQLTGEFSLHCPDGSTREVEFAAITHFIPGRHLSILRDISERRQLEHSLQASEANLNRILDSAIAAIVSFRVFSDRDWQYDHWSAGCEFLFGYTPEALKADKELWRSRVAPEDWDSKLRPLFDDFFAERNAAVEYRFHHKNGSLRWISSTYASRQISETCWQVTSVNYDITDRKQAESALRQQILREQLIAEISQDIRRSLDLNHVLSRTVERVRELLNTDRVIIFRFRPDWQGEVIMESVGTDWMSLLTTLIFDPCFREYYIEPYRQGRVSALNDIDQADLEACYVELLRSFQVKASLITPILQGEQLWGLLIAHHCSAPRQWQPSEIELLRQLATQAGIAIQQSELYEQTRQELLERERMQTILEESEERFRTLSTLAPIGICQANADGICLYTNAYWQEMSGLSFEDSLGNGWLQAVHPQDRKMLFTAWEAYLQGKGEHLPEFRLLTSKGVVRWVAAKVAIMRSATGDIMGYVSLHEDITERKRAEQKIREQAALIDIATDAIFVRDLKKRILFWNQGAERLYGWTSAEALGQQTEALVCNNQSSAQFKAAMKTILEQEVWQGEFEQKTKSGKTVLVASRWTLMRDEAGQPKSVLVVNTDITEKKQLEAQFYRAQRLESVGTLASGIAHDLNNVFTPILTLSQLLRLKLQNLDAQSQEMLEILSSSTKRGASLVKQILTFARGTEGKPIPLQVDHLLQEVVDIVQQTFPKSIRIRWETPSQPLRLVSADPTHLHQVLMNLCVNARDAMPGGGTLTLSAQNQFIDESMARINLDAKVDHYVVVTVADTGTGIPSELVDRIFDPFFTTKEPGEGTGLGLSTVLGIVKNYGGFLQVSSQVGEGTQFQVYLPVIGEPASALSEHELTLQGSGELILIVDDEIAVQQTNQALLESFNFRTLTASDGLEALDLYREHPLEIKGVLMDVMMPNMDGATLIHHLRRISPEVKILAISGLPSNQHQVLAAGANLFLAKPYTTEELLLAMQELMTYGRN